MIVLEMMITKLVDPFRFNNGKFYCPAEFLDLFYRDAPRSLIEANVIFLATG